MHHRREQGRGCQGTEKRYHGHPDDSDTPGAICHPDGYSDEKDVHDTIFEEQEEGSPIAAHQAGSSDVIEAEHNDMMELFEQSLEEMLQQPLLEASLIQEPASAHATLRDTELEETSIEDQLVTQQQSQNDPEPLLQFLSYYDMLPAVIFVNIVPLVNIHVAIVLLFLLIMTGHDDGDDGAERDE